MTFLNFAILPYINHFCVLFQARRIAKLNSDDPTRDYMSIALYSDLRGLTNVCERCNFGEIRTSATHPNEILLSPCPL